MVSRNFTLGVLLALLACPAAALAEPVYSMSLLPGDFDDGQVDGASTDETRDAAPFIYAGGSMRNLNRLVQGADGWTVVEAYDINDAQQILGKACRGDECLPVRLDLVSAVPEPGSYALLAAGLVLLAGWRRSGREESLPFSRPG